MRNKENKRPSAGKGSTGRGRAAGTGKPSFRDSNAPKRARSAGKPLSVRNTSEEKEKSESTFARRNKPYSTGKESSSSFSPRHAEGRPYEKGDTFKPGGRGNSKYPRHDGEPSRERSERPFKRKDQPDLSDKGASKYIRKDKPFTGDKDSPESRGHSERPYHRKGLTRTEDEGPKKYVRRDKPFSSDSNNTEPERSARPYQRRDSAGAGDEGPKKYVRHDKPFSSSGDSSASHAHGKRPYERKDSTRNEDGSPKKYIHRDKTQDSGTGKLIPRRDRPLAEPRKPILDLREEKLKASGDWKEGNTGKEEQGFRDRQELQMPKYARRSESDTIRLNKFIANAGICSRREADELIKAGVIKVNGNIVTEMGLRVGPRDKVQYGDQTLAGEKMVYVLLNKPKGYLTTSDDPFDRKTVMELVADACRERIYPVGRLDRNTTGLLLLTNDGDMAKKLTHPRHKVRKIYHVELDKGLTKSDMIRISDGVELEDGIIKADEIAYTGESKKEIGIELHSGKNRVVRRIFELLEYEVVKLDRVSFAGLTKKDLPRGRWRFLTESEVNYLKMLR
jgi:23S rRNA pseudouridine2605 synthase